MHEGLPVGDIPGKDVARELTLGDPLDLLDYGDRVAVVVIHARDSQNRHRNVSPLGLNYLLRHDLRFGIVLLELQRPVLINSLAGQGRSVDEHCAGEDKQPHFERLKRPQQPFGPANSDLFVLRAGLAREIVVRGQMDDCSDAWPRRIQTGSRAQTPSGRERLRGHTSPVPGQPR